MIVSKNLEKEKLPIVPDFKHLSKIGGGYYTYHENKRIYDACVESAKFMEKYGQGQEQPQIDLSHYENSKPQKECRKKNTK